jgi:CheY-like chemotaxis protein
MPYKLLLADDSVTIQRVIELTFAEEDVRVTAVSDGQHAIDLIQADRPDIVLADVGMPQRDGYEVAAFIKGDPALQHIPVLLLTGAFEPIDEERARSVRCDGVLAKPFEPQQLIGRVKELLKDVTPSPAEPPAVAAGGEGDEAAASGAAQNDTDTDDAGAAVRALLASPGADEPFVDPDATIRLSRPPVFPDQDLRLDVNSLEIRHEPPPAADASLDDYFDRLDAAFAHLTAGQASREGVEAPRPRASDPWSPGVKSAGEWPPVSAEGAQPGGDTFAVLDPDRGTAAVSGPGPEAGATSSPIDDLEAAAAAVAVTVPDAFAALLDAERDQGPEVVHRGDPPSAVGIVLPGTTVTQAFIDDVVRRVSERLGDSAVRAQVAEIVSAIAERLVREEIARLKSAVRP